MQAIKNNGFTLIEILIALSIFVVVGIITTLTLQQGIHSSRVLKHNGQQVQQLQFAIKTIQQDLQSVLDKPWITETGNEPGLKGNGASLQLTRVQNGTLQRINYHLQQDQLRRNYEILLTGVQTIEFKFIDHKQGLWTFWPLLEQTQTVTDHPFPILVQLTINSSEWGAFTINTPIHSGHFASRGNQHD